MMLTTTPIPMPKATYRIESSATEATVSIGIRSQALYLIVTVVVVVVVAAVVVAVEVVSTPRHVVDHATQESFVVATDPSSHGNPSQIPSATHDVGPGVPV